MGKHSIGETIAELRKQKGWTQVELAEKLQISDKAVSKWEKDNGAPSIEFFPILAELFGVSIDYIMTGKVQAKEVITMSKAELCAKNDDISLLKGINADHKDENEKSLVDYIVQYNSENVFVAFCEMNKRNISKFNIVIALKYCIILNRLDLLKGATFLLERGVNFTFDDEYEILTLLAKDDEKNFQGARDRSARVSCILTDDIFKTIVCDKRVKEETIAMLLGNQRKRQCVWYHVYPFLIHQAYVNKKFDMLDRLIDLATESNARGFNKYVKKAGQLQCHYYYVCREYDNVGHGFVRVLEETVKLALDNNDFDYVKKFNQINKEVNAHYGFNPYIASDDEIRIAKLKKDKNISKDDLALQSAIHNNILCIDEILATNDYKLIKKAFEQYPVHIIEYLMNFYNAEKWRELFEFAVDNQNTGLSNSIIKFDKEKIVDSILKYAGNIVKDINAKHLRISTLSLHKKPIENISIILEQFAKCKQSILEKLSAKLDKESIIADLTKEYFESELAKGNIEIVVIKLCVRMEAVLRCDYGYEGTFEEMLSKYCSNFNSYDDEANDYDPDTPAILNKLRKYRNNIVHSEKNKDELSIGDIKWCINYICKLG